MVHISRRERPEIVLFGSDHKLRDPVVLFAGDDIVVRGDAAGGLIVRRLTAGDDEEQIRTTRRLDEVLRAIVSLGGSYSDAVQAISEAKRSGSLESRVEYSAIPQVGRIYHRSGADEDGEVDQRSQLYGEPGEAEASDDSDDLSDMQIEMGGVEPNKHEVDISTGDGPVPLDNDNVLADDEFDVVTAGNGTANRGLDQESGETPPPASESRPGSGRQSADAVSRFELIDPAARGARR